MAARSEAVTGLRPRQVPFSPTSVAQTRSALSQDLQTAGLPDAVVDDAVLVLSEVLSNALRHARPLGSGRLEVGWSVQGSRVRLAVTDGGGPSRPEVGHPPPGATSGRGLAIVSELADAWGVDAGSGASTVWAVLDGPGPKPAGAGSRRTLDRAESAPQARSAWSVDLDAEPGRRARGR